MLAGEPPTIKLSAPLTAASEPPETGASTKPCPIEARLSARHLVDSTSIVEQSINRLDSAIPASSNCRCTLATCVSSGSIVIKTPHSAASVCNDLPQVPNALIARGSMSHPSTSTPFFTRHWAIGNPMVPSPINPIRIINLR